MMGRFLSADMTRWRSFLGRLGGDVRANTLAIVAASLVPLAGMIGGGLDMSRLYMTKTRLQHACDAGALAGRQAMGGGAWTSATNATAQRFFRANFAQGAYGTDPALVPTFTENAGVVTGTVSAILPMTLMKILGKQTVTVPISCTVDLRIPNTDIMFVLDTTGSMASPAVATDTQTKIQGLRTAVKCFYEIVAKIDTDANCTTGTPSGGTSPQTQVRFGFMPYSTNVNVGRLLPTSYFVDSWKYQSRSPNNPPVTTNTYPNPAVDSTGPSGSSGSQTSGWSNYGSAILGNGCTQPANTPGVSTTSSSDSTPSTDANGTITYTTTTTTSTVATQYQTIKIVFGLYCQVQSRTITSSSSTSVVHTQSPVAVTSKTFKNWHYGQIQVTTSLLKNGTNWNAYLTLPIGPSGSPANINWDGCIEERTVGDLDIDTIPTPGNPDSQWAPALAGLIYARNSPIGGITNSLLTTDESDATVDYSNSIPYSCPTQATRLQVWNNATAFDSYVDSLQPSGNTYHDIGMAWGARFLSPTGMFAASNAQTPTGGKIERNLIFMTDGDAQSFACDYAAHGVAWFDRRTTQNVGPNTVCSGYVNAALTDEINTRLVTLCTTVKNMNITLWVISFGSGSNTTTEQRLSNCATPGRYYAARDSAALQQTFATIANQISQLRLTN